MLTSAEFAPVLINFDDHDLNNYSCGEYSAMGIFWLNHLLYKNAYLVIMNSSTFSHTVCEVQHLGTYDFKNNFFFPKYYWHRGPITDKQLTKATKAVEWTDTQYYDIIDLYYKYDKASITSIQVVNCKSKSKMIYEK